MRCDDIDFITRNGHSDVFKNDVGRVFDSINLGIDGTPKLVFYTAITIREFENSNSWYRIPSEDRTVYIRNCCGFWTHEYEIAYKSRITLYGNIGRKSYYTVLRIKYDDIFSDAYSSDTCSRALLEQLRRINRELLNTEKTVRL